MANKVTFEQDYDSFRVYINGLVHIYVIKRNFQGFTSYKQGSCYYIELWLKRNRELIIHEDRQTWQNILKLLQGNLE